MKLAKYLMAGVAALALLGCGSDDDEGDSTDEGRQLSALQISPGDARVPVGFEQQFQVMAIWDDGMVQDVTPHPNIIWSSSDSAVVTIDDDGLAKGIRPGTALITTTGTANGEPYSATARVEVTDVYVTALQLTPANAKVPVGLSQPFVASATFSDGQTRDVTTASALSWHSQDEGIATVGNEAGKQGIATGMAVGSTTIDAMGSANGSPFAASAPLAVTEAMVTGLHIQAPQDPLPMGLSAQLHTFASLSDGSEPIEVTRHEGLDWSSSAPEVASISETGLATGLAQGSATIEASGTFNEVPLSATEPLKVSSVVVIRLEVQPIDSLVPVGLEQPFTATVYLSDGTWLDVTDNPLIQWRSSHPEIASVSSLAGSKGMVRGLVAGSATIMASGTVEGTPFTASALVTITSAVLTNLTITPPSAAVSLGAKLQFQAMATLSDGATQDVTQDAAISWRSDAPEVAAVSNAAGSRGEATGLSEGLALISAEMAGLSSVAAPLTVTPPDAILIEPLRKQFASLPLSAEEFGFWNRTTINSPEGQVALKALTERVYGQFQDEFDFITVLMNNDAVPPGMPTGEYSHVKNDVTGIGLGMFDNTAAFHSAGKLQGISFLYKKKYLSTSTYGPILHEMTHRWANWVVPSSYPGHWGAELGIQGQLNDVSANYADIELYLMGLMDASEMTDPASLDAYGLIPADQKPRVPTAADAQKQFRVLLLILSDRALTASEIKNYNDGATLLVRTDNPSQQGTNFHKMTGGRGTMVIGELDTLLKP